MAVLKFSFQMQKHTGDSREIESSCSPAVYSTNVNYTTEQLLTMLTYNFLTIRTLERFNITDTDRLTPYFKHLNNLFGFNTG